MKSTSTDVRRASHTHHAPHIGLPQSEPVTRQRKVKPAPRGAAAFCATSASGWRQMSVPSAAERHDDVNEHRQPCGRHVQIHDADRLALLIVGRRNETTARGRRRTGSSSPPKATAAPGA